MAPPWSGSTFLPFLHHNPAYAADAEGIRGFLGETWVHQISVMMHASGALLIAGALLGVLLVEHRARTTTQTGSALALHARGLSWSRILLVAGWAVNLLGGTMRLFEPDHPSVTEVGTVAWVQVLLIKHIIILGALFASLIAVQWAPRAWKQIAPKAAGIGIVLVFLSAILGGVSSGLTVPAQDFMMGPPSPGVPSPSPGEHIIEFKNTSFASITGTPLETTRQEFPFEVDHWAFSMSARIDWSTQQSEINAHLVDPNGDTAKHLGPGPGWAEATVDVNLYPGTWILVIQTSQAIMERVDVSIKLEKGTAQPRVYEGTTTVTRDGFFEINFWMDPDDAFHYEWSIPAAHGPVRWDIHTHPDRETGIYHELGEAHEGEGHFTAGNDQIYSIMWLPIQDRAFTITYRVEGDFRLHSIYG